MSRTSRHEMSMTTPHNNVYLIDIPVDYDDDDGSGCDDNYNRQVTPVAGGLPSRSDNGRRQWQLSSPHPVVDVSLSSDGLVVSPARSDASGLNTTTRTNRQEIVSRDAQMPEEQGNAWELVDRPTPPLVGEATIVTQDGPSYRHPANGRGSNEGDISNLILRRRSFRKTRKRKRRSSSLYRGDDSTHIQNSEDLDVRIEHLDLDELSDIRLQTWPIRHKLNTHRIMKEQLRMHDKTLSGRQEYKEAMLKLWRWLNRELSNFAAFFIPWEMRIKVIESHFGTVVASYFTFLRWMLWLNVVLAAITINALIVPNILISFMYGHAKKDEITDAEKKTAMNLKTLWDFEGYFKHSLLFYGHYSSAGRFSHVAPAYFLTGVAIFAVSYIIILRRMATNARQNGALTQDSAYAFSWKLFASWDYKIGNPDTSRTKSAEIVTQFREYIMEEQERKRKIKKILMLQRLIANVLVSGILASSAYAIYLVVQRSLVFEKRLRESKPVSWVQQNEVSIVTALLTALVPSVFDFIGMMEKYHPRVYLRWQLARIFMLYLLNLYTLLIALNNKIQHQIIERQNSTSCSNSSHTPDGETQLSANNCSSAASGGELNANCWETMIGQEFFKLMVFDLLVTVATILVIDFFRGLFVRHFYPCWFWDLERKFPEYGEFKVAENLLYLVNNQAMVWLGTFFSPALPAFNVFKLVVLMYVRSWAVVVCNVPPEGVFRASRSNNFFYAILLLMLFLVTVPILFLLLQLHPSPDCGPFREYERSYKILMATIKKYFPTWLVDILDYISSAGVIIPAFILLVMSTYYLLVLSKSFKNANADLVDALRYEMTEGKRKIYAMATASKTSNNPTG